MNPETVRYGLLAAAFLANVLLAFALRSVIRRRTTDSGGDEDRSTVHCPHCGTANDTEFRFCNTCAGDLDGSDGVGEGGLVASGGSTR